MVNTVRAIIVIIVLEVLGSIYFIFDIIKTYKRERRIAWLNIIEEVVSILVAISMVSMLWDNI